MKALLVRMTRVVQEGCEASVYAAFHARATNIQQYSQVKKVLWRVEGWCKHIYRPGGGPDTADSSLSEVIFHSGDGVIVAFRHFFHIIHHNGFLFCSEPLL